MLYARFTSCSIDRTPARVQASSMIRFHVARRVALVSLLLLAFITAAGAQNLGRASLSGVVRDETGAVIPGVTVTATREQTSPIVAVSGSNGDFKIDSLQPG